MIIWQNINSNAKMFQPKIKINKNKMKFYIKRRINNFKKKRNNLKSKSLATLKLLQSHLKMFNKK